MHLSPVNTNPNIEFDLMPNSQDAFDGSAEPVVYMSDNRMPVMIEFSHAFIYIIFAALILALLFILPGVRRTKFNSLFAILTLLTVGASILLALDSPFWLAGSVKISDSPYSSLTSETIDGQLQVHIGLYSANVTLEGKLSALQNAHSKNVDYNERFNWDKPDSMSQEHVEALRRGLPYPILTVTEFLSQDSEGFNWTHQLRRAGYFTSICLYVALASWCMTFIMMCALPIYLPHMLQITGGLIMLSVSIYTILIQSPKSFSIQVNGNTMDCAFGYTYVTTFMSGTLSMFVGVLLFAIQVSKPNERLTIMDLDDYVKVREAQPESKSSFYKLFNYDSLRSHKSHLKPTDHHETPRNCAIVAASISSSVIIPIEDIEAKFKRAATN